MSIPTWSFIMGDNKKKVLVIFLFLIIIVSLFFFSIAIRDYYRFRQEKYYQNQCDLSYSQMQFILDTIHDIKLCDISLYQLYKTGNIKGSFLLSPFSVDDNDNDLYFSLANGSQNLSEKEFYLVCGYKIIKNDGNSKFTIIDKYHDKLIIKSYINSKGKFVMKKSRSLQRLPEPNSSFCVFLPCVRWISLAGIGEAFKEKLLRQRWRFFNSAIRFYHASVTCCTMLRAKCHEHCWIPRCLLT